MTTTNLNVSELDFFTIKEMLKTHLNNQSTFSDYDFDGAGLSVLLDALAYSEHLTGVYTNLAFAETFLDSASRRSSVTSRAKELGYTPRSKSASQATIRISFSITDGPLQYVLPKGTRFTAASGGESFTFVTTSDHIINNDGADVFTSDVTVVQGKFATITYTVDTDNAAQRFTLGSKDADTTYLTVLHKDTAQTSAFNQFSFIDVVSIGDLASSSQVYFIQETYDEFFEVYFGDDVIGQKVKNGNVVELTYIITGGADANGAKAFTLSSSLPDVISMSVTTISGASLGGDRETIESIKYLAPFYYQAQGRAVTATDYRAIIKKNYASVDDVTSWGGEDNIPPVYGTVFIAIKPLYSTFFSNAIKTTIQNDINARFNVLGITPQIVDPDYIDVSVSSVVTYNARLFDGTTNDDLSADVQTAIEDFFDAQANRFGQPLYYSRLVAAIDEVSPLILNSVTNLTLSKSLEIFAGIAAQYDYTFNNAIHQGAVFSNEFLIGGIEYKLRDIPADDGTATGTLGLYRTSDGVFVSTTAGTIDYNTGTIAVTNIKIDSIVNDPIGKFLVMSVSPGAFEDVNNPEVVYTDNNVYTNDRDQIITLVDGGISLTLIPDESV